MKTLYFFYSKTTCSQVFVNKDGQLVRAIHENDGQFRTEYMGFIATFFGGAVVQIELVGVVDEEDDARFVVLNQASIIAAIAKAK